MQVKINESFQVDAPVEDVWAMLSDPNKVVTCVPGAKITETIDERTYKGTVSMKIGPVVTNFKGDIEIEHLDEATGALVLLGSGMDAKGKGSARMKLVGSLQALDGGGTEVTTSMEVSVSGKLAQFGSRLMEDVSGRVFEQFVECFQASVQPAEAAPAADTAAGEAVATAVGEAVATAPAPPPAQAQTAGPVKALPLLFKAIGASISRFCRRLLGRAEQT